MSIFILLAQAMSTSGISPEAIITRVDEIRNPSQSYIMKVKVQSVDQPDMPSVFEVSIRGNDKTLVRALEPPRDRGRNLLMLKEEMWAYIPNLKRAVRVSLSQKLTGQAANGDISRMRWSGDYTPVIESESATEWILLLSAKKKGLTYEKVRAWVDKSNDHPIRAEFLTPHGKILKRAKYSHYQELAGAIRPTEMTIEDALNPKDRSLIRILSMEVRELPSSLFNQNNLK